MSFLNVTNDGASTLAANILSTDLSLTVATGDGALFPATNFNISIGTEILLCTSRTGDVMTVVRAQEGTTAAAGTAGDAVELRITAGIIQELQNKAVSTATLPLTITGTDIELPNVTITTTDTAVGVGAWGSTSGAAVGRFANGSTSGAAVGYNTLGYGFGAAVGGYANGSTSGAAVGFSANGSTNGVAVGYQTVGLNNGTSVGFQAGWKLSAAYLSTNKNILLGYKAGLNLTQPSAWVALTAYTAGQFVRPTTGNTFNYEVTTAGTTGATEPTWNTTLGGTTTDGTVTWTTVSMRGNNNIILGYNLNGLANDADTLNIGDIIRGDLVTGNITVTGALSASNLSGTNTGDQTSVTGNAGTATSLAGGLGGQIPYQSGASTTALLANGTAGQVLQSNGTTLAPSWVAPSTGSGDVVGPASATDNAIARFNLTTGKLVQDSGVIITDANEIYGVTRIELADTSTFGAFMRISNHNITQTATYGPMLVLQYEPTAQAVASGDTLGLINAGGNTDTFGSFSNKNVFSITASENWSPTAMGSELKLYTTPNTTTTPVVALTLANTGAATFASTISASNLSGTNTGDQTTITGNAGSATVLQTARTINGVSFNGSANVQNTTTQITEGTNLYYTDTRVSANASVAANTAKVGVTTQISNVVEDTTPQLGGDLDAQANHIGFTQQAITYNVTTTTVDWGAGNKATVTLTGNVGTMAFTNPPKPSNVVLKIVQDITGGRTVTAWDVDIKWAGGTAPTLSTAAGAIDIIACYFDGTNYFGMASLGFA